MARTAEVIQLDDRKKKLDKSVIETYFKRFSEVRESLKESRESLCKISGHNWHRAICNWQKSLCNRSSFYIGRSITRLSFYGLNIRKSDMEKLITDLQSRVDLTGATTFANGRDYHIYFRKEK